MSNQKIHVLNMYKKSLNSFPKNEQMKNCQTLISVVKYIPQDKVAFISTGQIMIIVALVVVSSLLLHLYAC